LTGSDFLTQEEYYEKLFFLESDLVNQNWISRTKIWNQQYLRLNDPLDIADLPLALALVHPNHWVDWKGEEFQLSEEGWPNQALLNCEFDVICGIPCAWNADKRLQGKLHHDHRWPESLGGPESGYNLLSLCANHNWAKGNGLWGFDWGLVPKWLGPRLIELRDRKLHGIDPNQV
tara:strand:+ start:316 stop:840 length:525 start_codon:yes stop_codon:yes gene_type:complete